MSTWGRKEYKDLGFTDECATVLEIDRVQEVISRRAGRFNITVTWSRDAQTALTRNNPHQPGHYEIVLPTIESPCTNEDLIRTYMYVVHECGHLMRPDIWPIVIAAQPNQELMSIYNIVEDDSMERDVASRHLGDAKTLGEGNGIMCKDGQIFWEEAIKDYKEKGHEITEESLLPMIVMAIQMLSRREWDGWSREAVDAWLRVMPPVGQPLITDLVKEGWVDKFRNTKDEYDSWNVACDLYDRLYPPANEEEQQERDDVREAGNTLTPRESGDDTQDGEGTGEGEGDSGDEPSSGQSDGDPVSGEGQSEDTGDTEVIGVEGVENCDAQGYVINWEEVVGSEHSNKETELSSGGAMGITYEGREVKGGVAFMPDKMNNVIDLAGGEDLDSRDTRGYGRKGRAARTFIHKDPAANVLANKIRRYVQSKSRTRFRAEREHGKINGQELTRLLMPPVDNGNWNRKVFYDNTNRRALNTAVHILVDWSGSMSGDKQKFAAAAADRAADVFGRCLRMPVMVSSFTTHATRSDIAVMKHFDAPKSSKVMAEYWAKWCKWSGGNADGDAVMWAYRRLAERKEQRKLLIVMSDGAPCNGFKGHGHDALLAATRQIQDTTDVELFGLGIKSEAVKQYYDNYEVVTELEDINGALLEVMKRSISYD